MLKLENLVKDYKVADTTVHALRDVTLAFRKNEFVSILGPSGCGKTTLLNIIGGLDHYTAGEVAINGVSTKKYRDSDWDVYRNHRVGFIFQSYNLIPHQTVLGNVELALTIAGMSKAERVEQAKKALDRVGLEGQYYKKPNQLSGGQCQRVAIARALVNEPEILLADEPTGALDTVTSVQIMELIKEIAREKLVIMVTHNPELAEQYSTRIIRLLDGEVVGDSNPYSLEEEAAEELVVYDAQEPETAEPADTDAQPVSDADVLSDTDVPKADKKRKNKKKSKEKAKMSLWTAFRLSAQNLFTKKARTLMVSIAGAIGIIGVSLVLALSFGITSYINSMQNDMMSGNPITITESTFDMNAMMGMMTGGEKVEFVKEHGYVNVDSMVDTLIGYNRTADDIMIENEITQDYIDYVLALPEEDVASIALDYNLDLSNNVFGSFKANKTDEQTNMSVSAIRSTYISVLEATVFAERSAFITSIVDNFKQMPAGTDYILEQYDVLEGKIATEADEIMIVLNDDQALADVLLAQLGYYSQDEFMHMVYKSTIKHEYPTGGLEYYESETLAKPRFTYAELLGKEFTYYPNDAVYNKNPLVYMQQQVDAETTVPVAFQSFSYNHIEQPEWNDADQTRGLTLKVVGIISPKESVSYGCMSNGFYYTPKLTQYAISRNVESEIVKTIDEHMAKEPTDPTKASNISDNAIVSMKNMPSISYTYSYDFVGETHTVTSNLGNANFMTAMMGQTVYTLTKSNLAGSDLAVGISIYPKDFEHKDNVIAYLDAWNGDGDVTVNGNVIKAENRTRIVYNDTLTLIINLINGFIQIVTVALVGFTALSLVVSSVMIGIITYVSVVERTKEIGVIRSLGGRKKDVSRLFTAETAIIGFSSGAIGVLITYLLSAIINVIVGSFTIVARIAILPWYEAVIMIAISVLLTLISGVFPARAAAKKDPVVALRTE